MILAYVSLSCKNTFSLAPVIHSLARPKDKLRCISTEVKISLSLWKCNEASCNNNRIDFKDSFPLSSNSELKKHRDSNKALQINNQNSLCWMKIIVNNKHSFKRIIY